MLPEGWKRFALSDLAKLERGRFSVRPRNDPRYFSGAVPFVQTGDVAHAGIFLDKFSQTLNERGLLVSKQFPAGTILMTIAANIGATAITRFPVACPDSVVGITPIKERSDTCWLKYALDMLQPELDGMAGQNAQKNINLQVLDVLEILTPPSHEQQAIGQCLLVWDNAIAVVEKLLANSQKQRLALLGATLKLAPSNNEDVEKADNGGYPASVQPGIPALPATPGDWQRTPLNRHLHEARRPVGLQPERQYTLVTVKRSRGGVQEREVLPGSEIKTPTQFQVNAGDFLISKRQIVHGACGIVPPELDGAIVSNEYAVLNSDGEIDLKFLRYLSESRYFQQTCFHSSIGVHVEKMIFKTERWLSWPFNIPPLQQQRRIVEILDAATAETELMAKQLDALKQEKRALMAQLLTGKRRVRMDDQTMKGQP